MDYKDRFKEEYYQLKDRTKKLQAMLWKWDDGILEFEPSCPKSLLKDQHRFMCMYLFALETRARIENIEL